MIAGLIIGFAAGLVTGIALVGGTICIYLKAKAMEASD